MTSHPTWLGAARTPSAEECSIALIVERRATEAPEALFATFPGSRWTNAQAFLIARETAAALWRLGVRPDDRVVNWLPNSPGHLRVLLGAALLGAISVPLHTALRGKPLEDALRLARARVIVTHAGLVERLAEMPEGLVETTVALGTHPDGPAAGGGTEPALRDNPDGVAFSPRVQPWNLGILLFTSGTTAGGKAVRVPNGQLWSVGQAHFGFLNRDDRLMLTTPLCHIGPLSALVGVLVSGGSVIVLESFRTQTFWEDVRRHGATAVPGMGPSLLHFLNKAPPRPDDLDNGLRIVNVVAADDAARQFARRFGVSFFPSFGMTELSVPIVGDVDCPVEGSCGRVRDGMEVRIVDENDMEVPDGQVGEIIVRAHHPWVVNDGYDGNAGATVAAWRNGWFHTGDAACRDEHGNFFFADRIKDIIRRRGENISSIEVELGVKAFPPVADAVAVAVDSEYGDQEVLVIAAPVEGREIVPEELVEFLLSHLPHYMVPRYVRTVREMPRTPSNKIRKAQLRQEGLTPDVWDRDKAGIRVRARRLGAVE